MQKRKHITFVEPGFCLKKRVPARQLRHGDVLFLRKQGPRLATATQDRGICKKKENVYECKVIHDDVLLAWDYGHLTIEGSKFVASKYVIPAFKLPLR